MSNTNLSEFNDVYDEDFTGPTAFLIGNEGKGLTRELAEKADRLIRIPMNGKVKARIGMDLAMTLFWIPAITRQNGICDAMKLGQNIPGSMIRTP